MTNTKKKPKKSKSSKKTLTYLRLIQQLGLVTSHQFRTVFPDLSEERVRGILAKLKREGYIASSEMPKHKNAVFYFITKKGLRLIKKKSRWTHASCFKPRSLFEVYARSLFSSDLITEPGKLARMLMRPKDFEERFPQYAQGAPDRHFCVDKTGHLYALRVVATPPAQRLVSDSLKRFRRYLEHRLWRELIEEGKFSFVLILPSAGKAEQVISELAIRKKNREINSPTRDSTPLEKKFEERLLCWPSAELGRLLL